MVSLPKRLESAVDGVVKDVLMALERVLTRTAIGVARIAVRLGGVARRHETIESNAREVQDVTAKMRGEIAAVADSASRTADASEQVAALARGGREVSAQSLDAIRRLLEHSDQTDARLGALLVKVREVTGVSRLIEDIATRTRLLALNASIEATRAGAAGRAFGVVAGEVRELAKSTAEKTQKIDELMRGILSDLEPARAAMEQSRVLVAATATSVETVDQRLGAVNELAESASSHVTGIARSMHEQSASMGTLAAATDQVVRALGELREEARLLTDDAYAVSSFTSDGMHHLARLDLDTQFHRGLTLARALADGTGTALSEAVAQQRCSLDDVLRLEYCEIKNQDIGSLAHLFNVSRVPASGFTPPKFHTAYDQLIDVKLQKLCDDILGRDTNLLFALPIDLNSYGPIHNKRYANDWTGVADKDLTGNRVKRFFTDNSVLVRGARVGLGPVAAELPYRATRMDFQRTGCDLNESARTRDAFLVQTYARDTGAFVTVVTVPIFVKGRRWGASLIGWSEK